VKKNISLGVLGLLLLALLGWAFMPTPADVEVAAVTQGRFERSVQEDGKTRLRERYVVSTPLNGRVARIALKQGDAVERDSVVAALWPAVPALLDERARAEQAARTGAMQAAVARAQANVGRAAAALDQVRAELGRSEALARQGFVSPNQNETGRLNVRLRERELESATQEEDAARHELDQSRIALRQFGQTSAGAAAPQRAFEVKSPVSGKVLKVLQQSEGIVLAGTPLMELGDPPRLEVVVDILTEDAAQIKQGTAVQLSNWGGPDVLLGQVRLIEPAAFTKVSALGVEEQRVNAVIDISSPPEKWPALGDGFKVDVRVLVQVVENVVKVPVSALFPVGARSGVFVLEGGRARLHEIEVAARNGVDAWVKTGLKAGTQVIVYPDSKLKDGDSVQPR
jgi:HlyD family secretion protein